MKRQVLLLFGGESTEHAVSVVSASNVYKSIDKQRFNTSLGYIDMNGRWWLVNDTTEVNPQEADQLVPLLGGGSFGTTSRRHVVSPDVILPILHGKNGEDGSVQGLGQLMHIPVVGCDMTASAICMDKVAVKEILTANNIPNVPYITHRIGEVEPVFVDVAKGLDTPLFIKPARSGSSVGVSKASSTQQFIEALRVAHEYDDVVLIEKAITGRELEVAVIGTPPRHETSGIGEIIPGDEFYSYEAKYSPRSTSKALIPADLDHTVADEIRSLARKVYGVLGCKGMARIDFFLSTDNEVYLNEVNTIPGFTDISMYPKLWQQEGVSYTDLISRLLFEALGDTM